MRIVLITPIAAAMALVALGGCSDNADMASNEAMPETPDYRYAPPSVNPDLRDIPPPLESSPVTPQMSPTDPLAPPPASPPSPIPAPESSPG